MSREQAFFAKRTLGKDIKKEVHQKTSEIGKHIRRKVESGRKQVSKAVDEGKRVETFQRWSIRGRGEIEGGLSQPATERLQKHQVVKNQKKGQRMTIV